MTQDLCLSIQKEKEPVLLGLSGGPDSILLFYKLLEENISFIVAHIDHGWREKSSDECLFLSSLCKKHQVPFYYKVLRSLPKKNLEEEGRRERLCFFKKVYEKENCKQLLLGHHKTDRVETVLKKILEGSSLAKLNSFKTLTQLYGMEVYRPLLSWTKEEILQYLKKKKITYFIDETNEDTKFLRARMRVEIIPFLEEKFKKNFQNNLLSHVEAVEELYTFLEKQVASVLPTWQTTFWGRWLNLDTLHFDQEIQWRELARQVLNKTTIPKEIVNQLAELIQKKQANAKIKYKEIEWHIDRQHIFEFSECSIESEWEIVFQKGVKQPLCSSWKEGASGECWVATEGTTGYSLEYPSSMNFMSRQLTAAKVPACLRLKFPLLLREGKPYQDLLTGRALHEKEIYTHTACFRKKISPSLI